MTWIRLANQTAQGVYSLLPGEASLCCAVSTSHAFDPDCSSDSIRTRKCERARRRLCAGGALNLEGGRQHLRLSPLRQTPNPHPLLCSCSEVQCRTPSHLLSIPTRSQRRYSSSLTGSCTIIPSAAGTHALRAVCSVQCSPCTPYTLRLPSHCHTPGPTRAAHANRLPIHTIPVAP
jgi:hypothetical protein